MVQTGGYVTIIQEGRRKEGKDETRSLAVQHMGKVALLPHSGLEKIKAIRR